jgi:spore coat polysaccharide biosynthesis protein SpsF
MMEILGKPMIEHMVERVWASHMIDKIVISTSTHPSDDLLEEMAYKLKINCYRGSLENIMERISDSAKAYECDTIVELLGDNPLVHAKLIDDVVKFYKGGNYDYAATVTKEYPLDRSREKLFSVGLRVQIYSRTVAEEYINYPEYIDNDGKHPCSYIFEHPDRFKIGHFEAKGKWSFMNRPELSFAVNYFKNFNMIKAIFEKNYPADKTFSLEKVYEQLDKDRYLYLLMGGE